MKKKYLLISFLFIGFWGNAQLVNNGGTIMIQSGATLFCSGSLTNTAGTITNNGRIEVQGNFANASMYNTTTNDDSLIFTGAGNAVLASGGSPITYLSINKAANTDVVTLDGSAVVTTKLDYLSGILSTDYAANPGYELSAPAIAVFNFAAGREILGNVRRTGWTNGAARVFNAPHMQVTTNGGTSPASITVTMLPQSAGGDPTQAEREVMRKFILAQTGGTGFTANVRFPYLDAELNTNTEANLVPWSLTAAEWNAQLMPAATRDVAANWINTTGIAAASFAQEWKLADPDYTFNVTAFLRGPFSSGQMNTTLKNLNSFPLSQPYPIAPFNYTGAETVASVPANVVDWILVELRKPASGLPADANNTTIIGRKAGFVLNNGMLVDIDGTTPIHFDISKQGASFVVVRHRNHLGVMSQSVPSNALGTFSNNFSVLAAVYKNPAASSEPLIALPGSSLYGLWPGDANRSNSVNSVDINAIKTAISNLVSGYVGQDVNLNGGVNSVDVNMTKATISNLGQGSVFRGADGTVVSHLPADK